ncbi:MAG: hypothetical protein GY791_08875 [Alphaproteobacteria bacterium]|nr:hypothetical protein [Alphaproteobacteria bacterium]
MSRDSFAAAALADIPKILTLQDRNPHSPTYGCFDRNYWQYKIIDFPSGMAQEFIYPLALAWDTAVPNNAYYQNESVRDWAVAGLRFAARHAHADGSCDDYYPYERAAGATAFSLLAAVESYRLLDLRNDELQSFFRRRGAWLAKHRESGRLSNHEALIALNLALLGNLTGDDRWNAPFEARLARLLSWQDDEGWFHEYDGCDPGYLTLTISVLARIHELAPRGDVRSAIEKAVAFAATWIHPDGSFGGEYGSRNTYNFFPHGFELAGRWMPEALAVNDRFLAGLEAGRQACFADDHIIGHHCWNFLLAWRDFVDQRPVPGAPAEGRRHFPDAGLMAERRGSSALFLALNKGGVFKYFRDGQLVASDTQISLQFDGGATAVAHMVDNYETLLDTDSIEISGRFAWAKQPRMTIFKLMVLRLLMVTVGRVHPDGVRRLLQRLLITGRRAAPMSFRRVLTWREDRLTVRDEVSVQDWTPIVAAGIGGHQTSIHVVMSRIYQAGQLEPWRDLTDQVRGLGAGETLVVERSF